MVAKGSYELQVKSYEAQRVLAHRTLEAEAVKLKLRPVTKVRNLTVWMAGGGALTSAPYTIKDLGGPVLHRR